MTNVDRYLIIDGAPECSPCPVKSTCVVDSVNSHYFCVETNPVEFYDQFPTLLAILIVWNVVLTCEAVTRLAFPKTYRRIHVFITDARQYITGKISRKRSVNDDRTRTPLPPPQKPPSKSNQANIYPSLAKLEDGVVQPGSQEERCAKNFPIPANGDLMVDCKSDNNFNGATAPEEEGSDDDTAHSEVNSIQLNENKVSATTVAEGKLITQEIIKKEEVAKENGIGIGSHTGDGLTSFGGEFDELTEWLDEE